MAAPSTTNEVTVRRLSSIITGIWDKIKDTFQTKLPTTGTASGTYAINISGNAASATNATNHIANTSNPHSVTKSQVGLGSVVNTGDSATPVSGGTTKFTTGGAYTELAKKADKSATVTDVAWDTTNKKITKTINGTTSDVVTPGTMLDSFADSYENLAGTGIFIAANPQTAWKKYPISKLWNWIQQSIGSVLGLYIDDTTQEKRFSGTASEAVTATNATNANLSHSYNSGTAEGESVLQIGNGTAQSCVRSANTYKVYGWGTSSSGYAHTYWELGSNTSRPTLTISYTGTGSAYNMRLTESSLRFSIGSDAYVAYLEAYDGLVYQYSGSNARANYSVDNWTIDNPGSQFKITADRDTEKIEISKSSNTTTITGPAINTPQIELYGSTRSIAIVNNSNNDGLRVCQASNNANLYDLQARKFYGRLQGNVTGNADTATKATQDGNGNNIVNTYATKTSCLGLEGYASLPDTPSITPTTSWNKFDGWGTKSNFSQFHSFVTYIIRNAGNSSESIAVGFFTGSTTSGTQIALYNATLAPGESFTAVVPFMNRTTTSYGSWIKVTSGSGQTTEISQAYLNFSA